MLFELAAQECPDPALAAYRKVVIGRGKPLRAGSADCAIRAPMMMRYGSTKPSAAILKIMKDYRRTPGDQCRQNHVHIENGWPVVFVRRAGKPWPDTVLDFLENCVPDGWELFLFEYDDEAVDRIGG